MSFLRKQESRVFMPPKSPSPGLAFGQAGLSTARGEAVCLIRLNSSKIFNPFLGAQSESRSNLDSTRLA